MLILRQRAEVRATTTAWRQAGQRIGFVPTMGALHAGHLELVRQARASCDVVIASVFVNPTQFNNAHDLAAYPRVPHDDAGLLESAGCDALFLPAEGEMYPAPATTGFRFGAVEQHWEGASRPGHFSGVGLVVTKLFHLLAPHAAWLGQKDLQQVAVIRQLVRDLDFDLELVVAATVREPDGLAMASRNRRLPAAARTLAPALYGALQAVRTALLQGQRVAQAEEAGRATLAAAGGFEVEYLAVVDAHTLQPIAAQDGLPATETAVITAAWLAGVRLIDNVVLPPALA